MNFTCVEDILVFWIWFAFDDDEGKCGFIPLVRIIAEFIQWPIALFC